MSPNAWLFGWGALIKNTTNYQSISTFNVKDLFFQAGNSVANVKYTF